MVAPGIAEALFATAIGLVAAIPAVIAYNKLRQRRRPLWRPAGGFADEFSAILSRQLEEEPDGHGASLHGGKHGGRGSRRAPRPMAEINVTPMVDVMLVLLIIFMVTAPLLTVGVPVDLPKTKRSRSTSDKEPLTVTVDRRGQDLPAGHRDPARRNCAQTDRYQ